MKQTESTKPAAAPDVEVLTAAGRRRLEERLDSMAAELADLDRRSKNGDADAEDFAVRRRLSDQMEEVRRVLERAADVAAVDEDPSIVEVGDEVDVEDSDGEVETYALVHHAEANAAQNRISTASPLGRALLGARPGERVTVAAPGGSYTCVVRGRRRLS